MSKTMLAIALCTLLWACTENEPAIRIDLSRTEQVSFKESPDVLTYAYLPQYAHRVSYTRHHALVWYLRQATGLNIRQIFPDTFDQHAKMVGEGKIHISFSNPVLYVNMAGRYGARAFARIVEASGQDRFRGQIITRTDRSDIQTLEDCRNKRWIAVDARSAGGYLFPLGLFLSRGIITGDFREIAFAPGPGGKQEKVIFSVFAGQYDIGTIREGALDVVAGKIDTSEIRVLSQSRTYPGWVYAATKNLDPGNLKKIRSALVGLDFNRASHRQILERANFIDIAPARDQDFDSVRELTRRLGMEAE